MEVLQCKKCGHIEQSTYDGLTCPQCGGELKTVPLKETLEKRKDTSILHI
jgi:hypothetical protein